MRGGILLSCGEQYNPLTPGFAHLCSLESALFCWIEKELWTSSFHAEKSVQKLATSCYL